MNKKFQLCVKGSQHPVTYTFYDSTSHHGNFNLLWNCLCHQNWVSIYICIAVGLCLTDLQVLSSNAAGTFVFMKNNTFLKSDFLQKLNIFSYIFKSNACYM